VIPTGGRTYIGRKVMEQPVQSAVRREPATAHPELDGYPA
jgi:hypothetical protein